MFRFKKFTMETCDLINMEHYHKAFIMIKRCTYIITLYYCVMMDEVLIQDSLYYPNIIDVHTDNKSL